MLLITNYLLVITSILDENIHKSVLFVGRLVCVTILVSPHRKQSGATVVSADVMAFSFLPAPMVKRRDVSNFIRMTVRGRQNARK